MVTETWYVLENGAFADPNDVSTDEKGALRHKSGAAVAMGPHGPRSRSVDADEERAKSKATRSEDKPYRNREMKAKD